MPRKRKRKKQQSLRLLKRKVWKLVSTYVRLSRADKHGIVQCYTCTRKLHWQKMHCGHYRHNVLDYNLNNLKPQCPSCNLFRRGNLAEYTLRLIKDNGSDFLFKLAATAKRKKNEYTRSELELLASRYHELLEPYSRWLKNG
jgi:hypothetical protein